MSKVWPVHYVLGLAGVALIRNWMAGDETAAQCFDDLAKLTREFTENPALRFELDVPQMEPQSGYELWADTYDTLHNPLIDTERPIIQRILETLPPGRALDAGCGTGRYTRYLQARGHRVTALDASGAMLSKARADLKDIEFAAGTLEAIPFTNARFDVAMCGLALTHLEHIDLAISELSRVLRRGGTLILADHHPMAGILGGSAIFRDKDGYYRNIRSFVHPHSEYVGAFVAAGLDIRECIEPGLREEDVAPSALFNVSPEAYRRGAVGLPMALIWRLARR